MGDKSTQKIRKRCGKFRILIIGRANAGKTTVLKRVCDTTEEPEVYNRHGERLDRSILAASAERGEHDIENEMIFTSNPGFIFHDSPGFESGGIEEVDRVNAFITYRSQERKLENRLHAIWYCIPVDDSRPFTTAESQFFSVFGTGCVPVIAMFTKFDALDNKAFAVLRERRLSRADARKEAPKHAITEFEQHRLNSFYDKTFPPRAHVYLRDMNKEGTDCNELLTQTAGVLDDKFLENLLVSTQQNSLELCIEYSFKRVVLPAVAEIISKNSVLLFFQGTLTEDEIGKTVIDIWSWFPQFRDGDIDILWDDFEGWDQGWGQHWRQFEPERMKLIYNEINGIIKQVPKIEQTTLLGMVGLSAQKSFFRRDLKPYDAFLAALQQYSVSSQRGAVALAVKEINVAMPSRLDKDTHDEWEKKTLQALMQIVCNNLLELD